MNLREFKEVLDIIAKHSPRGEEEFSFFQPEHDVVHLNITISKSSEDGKRLKELGCMPNYDGLDTWGAYISC